jgi:hypothetical protein
MSWGLMLETVQNVGGLSTISLGGRTGWSTGKRDDQGRDDLPALFSPHIRDGLGTLAARLRRSADGDRR